jgi:hypothetical protein
MAERPSPKPIKVDVNALRHAQTERILERKTPTIVDFRDKLARLKEFSVLSDFARARSRDN